MKWCSDWRGWEIP